MKALYWLPPHLRLSVAELSRLGYLGLSPAASCLNLPVDPVMWSYLIATNDEGFYLKSRSECAPPVEWAVRLEPMTPIQLWEWVNEGIKRHGADLSEETFEISRGNPRQLLALGSKLLRHHAQVGRHIDSEGCGFSFTVIGIGMIWLYRLTVCEICYRLVGPGQTRCALHSRSKIRPEQEKRATRLELRRSRLLSRGENSGVLWRPGDDRIFSGRHGIAEKTRSQFPKSKKSWRSAHCAKFDDITSWFGPVPAGNPDPYTGFQSYKPGPFNSFVRMVLPDLLWPEREREDSEVRDAWDTQLKSSMRVRRQLPVTLCWMSFDQQVSEVRTRLDSEAPTIRVLIKSLEIAERWFEEAEAIDKGHTRQVWTEQDFRRIAVRQRQGAQLSKIAAALEVCPDNLRRRMALWQQSSAKALKSE